MVDIKGELATITANRRALGNERVKGMNATRAVLDPVGITPFKPSANYNPLSELAVIEKEEGEDAAAGFAGKIIEGIAVSMKVNDPFWDTQSRSIEPGKSTTIISASTFSHTQGHTRASRPIPIHIRSWGWCVTVR